MAQKPIRLPTSTLPTTTSPTVPPALHNALLSALLHSGSTDRIKTTIADNLSAAGWTENLRTFIQELLRSGECTTYNEILARVMEEVGLPQRENGANGHGASKAKSVDENNLRIPDNVVKQSIGVVRGEIEKVAEIVVDDE